MDNTLRQQFDNLSSKDDKERMAALQAILELTEIRVDWIYEVWDELFQKLEDPNSFHRSIAIMVLCNLAKSDREKRFHPAIDIFLQHTRDEKFITSRQCIQNIWKVAAADQEVKRKIISHLETQYEDCIHGKHYNLIRQDIIQAMMNIYQSDHDVRLLEKAKVMVESEGEPKYQKKYAQIMENID